MDEMFRILNNRCFLVFCQNLSNEEDRIQYPESYTDIGHPIKTDLPLIEKSLYGRCLTPFEKILPRYEGRNPRADY